MVSAFIEKIVDKSLESVLKYLEIDWNILQYRKPFRIRIIDDATSSGSWTTMYLNPSWSPDLQATVIEECTHGLYQRFHDPMLRSYKIGKLSYEEQLYLNAVQEFIAGLMRLIMTDGKTKIVTLTESDTITQDDTFPKEIGHAFETLEKAAESLDISGFEHAYPRHKVFTDLINEYSHVRGYKMAQMIYDQFRRDERYLRQIAIALFRIHPRQAFEFGDALINGLVTLN